MQKGESIMTNNQPEIHQCFLTNNDCYKECRKITPKGIIVHSTGVNNTFLKRYIQPDDGIIGVNEYNNHWNQSGISKCVHAFIGKDTHNRVKIYQTLPWNYRCWGCGKGTKGTYNDNYIQFEICEDGLADVNYFNETFCLAAKLCAYLSSKYEFSISNILSHHEAYKLGYASNHNDCDNWLTIFDRDMNWFRAEISNIISDTIATSINISYLSNGIDYSLVFDPVYYFDKYNDLKKAFGADTNKLFSHFIQYGMNEGRKACINFDVNIYKNKYSDLRETFKNDLPSYYKHYIQYGYTENRSGI